MINRHYLEKSVCVILLIMSASCAGPRPPVSVPADSPGTTTDAMVMSKTLTVEEALDLAWNHHPAMKQAKAQIAAAYGEKIQAGLWPRPDLGISYLDKDERETTTGISLSQKLEIGGKRRARVSAAAAKVFLEETEHAAQWADIRSGIKEAFARLAYSTERVRVQEQITAIDKEQMELAASLHGAGKISEQESIKSREKFFVSSYLLVSARAQLKDSERQVLYAVGMAPTDNLPEFDCHLDVANLSTDEFSKLIAMTRANNPLLATARAKTAAAKARHRLAKTSRWCDIKIGAQYRSISFEDGESGTGMEGVASLDLPLWNRAQGNVIAARERVTSAAESEKLSALDVFSTLSELTAEHNEWNSREKALREDVLPLTAKRHALTHSAFSNGKASKRTVLESKREFQQVQLETARAKLMLNISALQLERIVYAAIPPK